MKGIRKPKDETKRTDDISYQAGYFMMQKERLYEIDNAIALQALCSNLDKIISKLCKEDRKRIKQVIMFWKKTFQLE